MRAAAQVSRSERWVRDGQGSWRLCSLRVGWRQNQQNMATDGGRAGGEREVEDDARVLSEGPAGHTEGAS